MLVATIKHRERKKLSKGFHLVVYSSNTQHRFIERFTHARYRKVYNKNCRLSRRMYCHASRKLDNKEQMSEHSNLTKRFASWKKKRKTITLPSGSGKSHQETRRQDVILMQRNTNLRLFLQDFLFLSLLLARFCHFTNYYCSTKCCNASQ